MCPHPISSLSLEFCLYYWKTFPPFSIIYFIIFCYCPPINTIYLLRVNYNENIQLINNGVAFLFDEIRYEICGTEIDRIKNAGITTTMKNVLTFKPNETKMLVNAGWTSDIKCNFNVNTSSGHFYFCIPLRLLFGFAEDCKRIMLNVKQELVLIRSSSNNNAVQLTGINKYKLTLSKIHWRIPYVHVSDEFRLQLLKIVDKDQPIPIAFRKWELHEIPFFTDN